MAQELKDRFFEIIRPICNGAGYDLVDIEIKSNRGDLKLVVFIDCAGGISIDDCVIVNNLLDSLDEIDALFEESYTLEVSSPGPNRPLRSINDFVRYEGRNVKIIAKNIIDDGKKVFVGSIVSISETIISINDSGKVYAINFDEIEKANLRL
tara:strand:+ start:105 stop:560 length:456 start_codon:yes stop_codon:yes gene_type:complete